MAKYSFLKRFFNLGEFGKRAFGLAGTDDYPRGVDTMENCIPLSTGGFRRRDGSRYLEGYHDDTEISDLDSRYGQFHSGNPGDVVFNKYHKIIPIKTTTGSAVIVITPTVGIVPPGITSYLVEWDGDDYSFVQRTSNTAQSHPAIGGITPSKGISGSNLPNASDLLRMKSVQVGDFVYLVSGNTIPFYVGVEDGTSVTYGNIYTLPTTAFTTPVSQRVPYTGNNDSTHTLTPSATTGAITLTSTDDLFHIDMIGETIFRLNSGSVMVKAVTSPTVADVEVIITLSGTGATSNWEESAWSDYRGWPTEVVYYESRLYYFRGDTLWASQSSDVTEMSTLQGAAINAASPFSLSIGQESAATICWASAARNLVIGTEGAEYVLVGPDRDLSISATNVDLRKETENGSYIGAPTIRISNALYFIGKEGDIIHEFVFDERENAYRTKNITQYNFGMFRKTQGFRTSDTDYDFADGTFGVASDLATRAPIKIFGMHRQIDQDNIIWLEDNYGGLTSITIDRPTGTYGFAYHKMGGSLANNDIPKVHSIGVADDRLYMLVERTVNSIDVGFIEVIPRQFLHDVMEHPYITGVGFTENLPIYTDATVFDSDNNNDITDLDNLNIAAIIGETVSIMSDGRYVGTAVVAANKVTSPRTSKILTAGLPYESKVKLLPIEAGAATGSASGSVRKAEQAIVRFNRTVAASIGIDEGETGFDEVSFRTAGMLLSAPIPMFYGLKFLDLPYTEEEEQQVVIKTDKPLPMEVISLTLKGITYE